MRFSIDSATAAFLFGPRANEFASVRYGGRVTKVNPSDFRRFTHVDTYTVVRHGDAEWCDVPDGDDYVVPMSEGTEFDIVITDHGIAHSLAGLRRYKVEVVGREVRIGERDARKVVVTADFDVPDDSPPTVHRMAVRYVMDRFPARKPTARGDVPVTS